MKAITTGDAVPLSGSLSCFAAVADAVADSSATAETAAVTIAACGLSYCSSAVVDGATAIAAAAVIPSANTIRKNSKKSGPAAAGPGFYYIQKKFCGFLRSGLPPYPRLPSVCSLSFRWLSSFSFLRMQSSSISYTLLPSMINFPISYLLISNENCVHY